MVEHHGKWCTTIPSIFYSMSLSGKWPRNLDDSSTYPQHLLVDYVRVYQQP